MKTVLTILLVILAVIISGCTSQAPAATPTVTSPTPQSVSTNTAIPDMTGLWKGTGTGFTTLDDFTYFPMATFNISKQKGQIFTGRKEYPRTDGKTYYENFVGMVTMNGEIYEADSLGGFSIGKLTGPNSMELNYIEEGNDTKAIIITLSRQKS
jgi:hypothetical protein